MPQAKLTQAFVDSLPFSQNGGTQWYHDTELPGLQLAVGKTTKTYFASAEHNRRFLRVKVGRADVTPANVARRIARDDLLPAIRQGKDPRPPKPVKVVKVEPAPRGPETFLESFQRYRRDGTSAKASTLQEYERLIRTKLPDWLDRPTAEITKQDVRARYRLIAVGAPVAAQAVMRVVSAVMRHAAEEEVIESSPVILKKGWSVPKRCQERIGDVGLWWRQVDDLNGQMATKSVLKLLLLTGLRPTEVLSLRWADVDLEAGKVHIRDPKRGPARDAALSNWSVRQLDRLRRLEGVSSQWVFPSHSSTGHLLSLPAGSGHAVKWSPYCCRREWASVAAELGIPYIQRATQMGHSASNMTDSYVVTPDVREAVQRVADELMRRTGSLKAAAA